MISVWYVYLDEEQEWLTDSSVDKDEAVTSSNWQDAQEFHSEDDAKAVAEEVGGVVFGWCQ